MRSGLLAGSVLAAVIAVSAPAIAQSQQPNSQQNQQTSGQQGSNQQGSGQQGVTSGPAVGTAVAPSTAVQKQDTSDSSAGSGVGGLKPGAVGVGAPGVTAKQGTEGGPSPAGANSNKPH